MTVKEIVTSISPDGELTLPPEVRNHLGNGQLSRIVFILDEDGVHLRPAPLTVNDLAGRVSALPGRESIDFEDQIEEAMEEEAVRVVRKMGGR